MPSWTRSMTAPAEGPTDDGGRWSPPSVVSGTTVRFALLVIAVLATGAQLFTVLYLLVPGHGQAVRTAEAVCGQRHAERISDLNLRYDIESLVDDHVMRILAKAHQERWACVSDQYREMAYWVLGGLAAVLITAALLYVVTPLWKQSRPGLSPLRAPQLRAEVTDLVKRMGLSPQDVSFVLSTPAGDTKAQLAVKTGRDALTYGRSGRYVVQLDAGLVVLFRSAPHVFRAVVLHELAHIRNRDVGLGYAALAIWRAFLVVAITSSAAVALPVLLVGDGADAGWELAAETGRILAFAAIAQCALASVCRLRELHADARAACVPDARDGVIQAVERSKPVRGGFARPFAKHPSPALRREALRTPQAILRPGFWESAGVGCIAMAAATGGVQYGSQFMPVWTAQGLAVGVVTVFLLGALTAVVWRAAVLRAHYGGRRFPLRPLLGLSVGVLLGDPLAMSRKPAYWGSLGLWPHISPGAAVVSAALLVTGLGLITAWLAGIAAGWLSAPHKASPRRAWLFATAVASVTFGPFLLTWFRHHNNPQLVTWTWSQTTRVARQQGWTYWEGPASTWISWCYAPFQDLLHNPPAVPVLFLIALVPLLTGSRPPLAPVVTAGLLGGLWLIVGQVVVRTLLYLVLPGTVAHPGFAGYYINCQVALAALGQAVVAGILVARRLPAAAALLAALLTGTVSAVALPGLGFMNAQALDGFSFTVLPEVLFKGALAAGVATALVRIARACEPPVPGEVTPPRLMRYGVLALAILAVSMIAEAATQSPSYALRDDLCAAVDTSPVRHLAGGEEPAAIHDTPMGSSALGAHGAQCRLEWEGPEGSLRVDVMMSLPEDGRTGALRVLYGLRNERTCGSGKYRELDGVGTLAWGGHEVNGSGPDARPGSRSEHEVCVQDGGLFLRVHVTRTAREPDTARHVDVIDFLVQEVADKTMARLADES